MNRTIRGTQRRLNGMAALTLQGVKKTYDGKQFVLHGIDVDVADGEFVVLVGPSGCGKSTLLRMVAGLESDPSGDDLDRRPRGQQARAEGARHRDGVPELRALSAHERRAKTWPTR